MRAVPHLAALQELFDPAKISRSAAKFDPAELTSQSRTDPDRLSQLPIVSQGRHGDKAEPFWLAVRENIARLDQAGFWWRIARGPGRWRIARCPRTGVHCCCAGIAAARAVGRLNWKQWTMQ